MKSASRGSRLGRTDWLDLGLRLMAEDGPDALRIERLCAAAARTKGSFYHHFDDHDGFVDALLAHWQDLNTERIIRQVDRKPGRDRSEALTRLATEADQRIELAIRRLAASDDRAAAMLRRVDERRLQYLADINPRAASKADARIQADLSYAAFIGLQMLFPDRPPKWHQGMCKHLAKRLGGGSS